MIVKWMAKAKRKGGGRNLNGHHMSAFPRATSFISSSPTLLLGVMNTDNFSILSLTIDYGPFGFLDAYIPSFIPNTSDDEGRYSYENQPNIGFFNLDKLREALSVLLDAHQQKQ